LLAHGRLSLRKNCLFGIKALCSVDLIR